MQEIKKYEVAMTSNGIKVVPNFMNIGQLFKNCEGRKIYTDRMAIL
jgi:hypothetical protein